MAIKVPLYGSDISDVPANSVWKEYRTDQVGMAMYAISTCMT